MNAYDIGQLYGALMAAMGGHGPPQAPPEDNYLAALKKLIASEQLGAYARKPGRGLGWRMDTRGPATDPIPPYPGAPYIGNDLIRRPVPMLEPGANPLPGRWYGE